MSATYQVINPADETNVKTVELADLAATDAAIEKAYKTFETWKKVTPADRAKLLRAFAQIVFEHREELASLR